MYLDSTSTKYAERFKKVKKDINNIIYDDTKSDGYFMELKISDLPPQFENIAIELGIDKIKALFKEFGGTSVYFPTEKMIYKDARDREIISQYNGFNHKELAAKYNMSESYIRAIINRHKKSA